VVPSYLLGESASARGLANDAITSRGPDQIYIAVEANIPNPTNEALWALRTMLAAWHLWEATESNAGRDLFLQNVEQLWKTWTFDRTAGCHLWTQDCMARSSSTSGRDTAFAGNAFALLKGANVLVADRRHALMTAAWRATCTKWLTTTALFIGPSGTVRVATRQADMLMQWCHGAPGVVTS